MTHLGSRGNTCTIAQVEMRECNQRQQDPTWRFSQGTIPMVQSWIVTLISSTGVMGHGHVLCTPLASPDSSSCRAEIEHAAEALQGADALLLDRLQEQVAEAASSSPCVISGFVGAAHELVARMLGVPLHRMLGDLHHERIPVWRLIPIKEPEAMAAEAVRLSAAGYRMLKLKLSGHVDEDIARVRAARRAVGPGVRLSVDANQAYEAPAAIEVCRALLAEAVVLMEQPVAAADIEGLKRVSDATAMRIEADESIGSVDGLEKLLRMRAAGAYNLKVHYLGGLRNTLKAMRMCDAARVPYRLGAIFGPRLASAQAAHLAAVAPSVEGGAEIAEFTHLLDDPFSGFEVHDGAVRVSAGPGSGTTLAELPGETATRSELASSIYGGRP